MLLELHIIQSFAPSNLNRDDTNAPKDCFFGGVRRARISSQCIKRALRKHFISAGLIGPEETFRTKRLPAEIAKRLTHKGSAEDALAVAKTAIRALKIKFDADRTSYAVFTDERELGALITLCDEHWETLLATKSEGDDEPKKRGKGKKAEDYKGKVNINELAKAALDKHKAADIALFGRMLADVPEKNVNAASQVAHALSTHKVEMEMDFYTAVDDLQTLESEEGAGAGMMGTVSFNAACFYRYANVHYDELVENLKKDADLARKTVAAFLRGSLEAVPSGKQNTFAAYNPPSFVMTLVREKGQPVSLANAFERPVRPGRDGGVIHPSVQALDVYWGKLAAAYGLAGDGKLFFVNVDDIETAHLPKASRASTADELVAKTVAALG